jgi:hypothetical protein
VKILVDESLPRYVKRMVREHQVFTVQELSEPEAEIEAPDGEGGFVTQVMSLWTPASFTIGESGVWFFSLMWENGAGQPPVEFLDERNILTNA